jgi:hypothetical protein
LHRIKTLHNERRRNGAASTLNWNFHASKHTHARKHKHTNASTQIHERNTQHSQTRFHTAQRNTCNQPSVSGSPACITRTSKFPHSTETSLLVVALFLGVWPSMHCAFSLDVFIKRVSSHSFTEAVRAAKRACHKGPANEMFKLQHAPKTINPKPKTLKTLTKKHKP